MRNKEKEEKKNAKYHKGFVKELRECNENDPLKETTRKTLERF